jgi:NAD(P)-dependent dehydrogenase (short-subunit alcohol dehydrogenase family)
VLITGAARGIGAELARRAAARGARDSLVGLEPERLAAVADELGPEHLWVEADVTDAAALEDDEVLLPAPLQLDRHAEAGEARPDDRDLHVPFHRAAPPGLRVAEHCSTSYNGY